MPLEVGKKAPAFSGKTHDGTSIKLSEFLGQKVALYFYPKDDTPGCTKQACNLRDNFALLQKRGIVVIGVSPDDNARHQKFTEKYDLPFPLLPDPEHKILEKYGVWGEKSLYGKVFDGVVRTTFLIDEAGKIVDVIKKPKVADHTAEILARFGL
ncbi:MAG: thioredoxin-dependent thiol peroxidase [Myxococcota bacterium]|jgi:peroxiredoxin Q/BCP